MIEQEKPIIVSRGSGAVPTPYLNDVELRNVKNALEDISRMSDITGRKAHDFSRATLLVKLDEIATRLMEARQAIL